MFAGLGVRAFYLSQPLRPPSKPPPQKQVTSVAGDTCPNSGKTAYFPTPFNSSDGWWDPPSLPWEAHPPHTSLSSFPLALSQTCIHTDAQGPAVTVQLTFIHIVTLPIYLGL